MKKIILVLVSLILVFCATITAFANEIQPYYKTYYDTKVALTVDSSGTYRAKTEFVFTANDGTIEKATKTIERTYSE